MINMFKKHLQNKLSSNRTEHRRSLQLLLLSYDQRATYFSFKLQILHFPKNIYNPRIYSAFTNGPS